MADKSRDKEAAENPFARFRSTLRLLYHSQSPVALRFQFSVLVVDLAIIAFFIATPLLRDNPSFLWIDYSIAALLALDIVARALASTDVLRWLQQLPVIVDIFILLTLLAPDWFFNLGFLRILRLWTLSRSPIIWRPLKKRGLAQYQDTIQAVVNLLVFLFIVTGFVYTAFVHTAIRHYRLYRCALFHRDHGDDHRALATSPCRAPGGSWPRSSS